MPVNGRRTGRTPGRARAAGPRTARGGQVAMVQRERNSARRATPCAFAREVATWVCAAGVAVCAVVLTATLAGCTAPRGPLVVTDPDPSVKIPAIKKAVRKRDRAAVRQLVAELDSDDPAVRFYAISGLERMTGERFGYDYYSDETGRTPAVTRWREWLDGTPVQEANSAR